MSETVEEIVLAGILGYAAEHQCWPGFVGLSDYLRETLPDVTALRHTLASLVEQGEVIKEDGRYRLARLRLAPAASSDRTITAQLVQPSPDPVGDPRLVVAASAMMGILAGCGVCWRDGTASAVLTPQRAAEAAVSYADALLARLQATAPAATPTAASEPPPEADSEGGEP